MKIIFLVEELISKKGIYIPYRAFTDCEMAKEMIYDYQTLLHRKSNKFPNYRIRKVTLMEDND